METVDMQGITGDIGILVTELSKLGCGVTITEWVESSGSAVIEAHLPDDADLAEQCRQLVEERKGAADHILDV